MVEHRLINGGYCFLRSILCLLLVTVMGSEAWGQTAGVTVSPTRLSLDEGTSGNYTMNLNTQPTGNVTITIASNNAEVTTNPGALTFSNSDWATAQTVTVSAGSDADSLNDSAQLSHTVSGYGNVMAAAVAVAVADDEASGICGRTQQVRDAIVAAVSGITDCANITATHLGSITGILNLGSQSITTLQAGDFAGLTALTTLWLSSNQLGSLPAGVFDELTALTWLSLFFNQLGSLPAGVFDELTVLTSLDLSFNQLGSLPAGVFDELTALTQLLLFNNQLGSLPAGVFDELTALTYLGLFGNSLSSLPAGVFDGLTALTQLLLFNNQLSSLPPGVFDELTALTQLWLFNNQLGSLPAGVFDELTVLTSLDLSLNQLSRLPAGVFTELTALTDLRLHNNQLGSLPAGVFAGLTNLDVLLLHGNAVDLLPLPVSIVPTVVSGQVKATIPSGAPFALTLPVTVTNGTTTVSRVSIAAGGTESTAFTITRTDAGQPSSVDINRLPDLPADTFPGGSLRKHQGYHLVKADLPLQLFAPGVTISLTKLSLVEGTSGNYTMNLNTQPTGNVTITVTSNNAEVTTSPGALTFSNSDWNTAQTVTVSAGSDADSLNDSAQLSHTVSGYGNVMAAAVAVAVADDEASGICGRTQQVRDAIVAAVSGITDCANITATHLENITGLLDLGSKRITTLQAGDFAGLTALTRLSLLNNQLQTLPAGVFDNLTALEWLILFNNQLGSLPAGVFDELTALTFLWLYDNQLGSLPAGVFDGLTALTSLSLFNNQLGSLPAGVFDELTALTWLSLLNNQLGSLPAGVFDGLTALTSLSLNNNQLGSLPAGVFDELTALTWLSLNNNELGSLPAGVFDGLTALTTLYLNNNELDSLPAGVFDGLTALTVLWLYNNELDSLPAGVFDGLTALTVLYLYNNELDSLPAEVFNGLTQLDLLWLQGNLIDPLPLPVSIVPTVVSGQVKATIPSGAPFALTLPVTVTNGTTTVSSVSIATGGTESTAFTITRTNASQPSAVDISSLPVLPVDTLSSSDSRRKHQGYHLVKADLPLQLFTSGVTISQTSLSLDEGNSGNYMVNLNTQPTGNVTIDISSSNGEVTTNPSALTFSNSDWDTAQTVTVMAGQDGDALNDTAVLSHTVSGYGGVTTADNVTVTVTDGDDIPEATADVNGDRYINAEDALLLFYIYRFESSPGVRNTLLMRRLGNDADEVNKAIMRANAWKLGSSGDLNLDGDVDAQDALIMYFAWGFEDLNLAREHATLRELLLSGLGTGTDSSYRQWLRRAETLR